jgi:hypothetical protein
MGTLSAPIAPSGNPIVHLSGGVEFLQAELARESGGTPEVSRRSLGLGV